MDAMNLSDRRNFELHSAVAAKIERHPELLAVAARNLERLRKRSGRHRYFEEWAAILTMGPAQVIEMLRDQGEKGQVLRSASPFTGLLTEPERLSILERLRSGTSAG